MSDKRSFDWFEFGVRFFFGAIFGVIVGAVVLTESPHVGASSWEPAAAYCSIGALICGVLAGVLGDEFWTN